MKLLLLILALTVCQITPADIGGYNLVDPSELNQDKGIQDLLSFGARYVVEQGIQAQDLPDSDYEVTAVYGVYKQVVSGINYMFDVEIQGADGTILRSSYIVYDQSWTNTREVSSYNYDIEDTGANGELENLEFLPDDVYWSEQENIENEEATVVGGWTQQDLSEVENDPDVQALLNFGVQDLTQQEVLAQKLPDAQYTVSQIHSVWSQVVSGMNYRFDVDITNDLGWVLRATFVVYSQPWTDTQDVTSYVYAVTTNPNPSEEEEFVIPEEDLPGGYQTVDPSEVNTDRDLQDALGAGVGNVVSQAVIDHQLPESTYNVAQIHSIYSQVVSGTNYRFDVDLVNCAGLVARAVFVVYSEPWTHTIDTTSDSLEITSIPAEGLIGGDCPNDGDDGGDDGGDGNEEAVPGEMEWGETGPIVGDYKPVDLDEAKNDPVIQGLMNFGAQFVATEGINGHRLPDSKYEVSNLFSVNEQVVAGTNYQFDVELVNCHGLTVRANYIVYYVPWEDAKQVAAYSFDITSAPNGFFIGGC